MTTSQGSGAVVLAAYRPDPDLFLVQLRSIRDQTRDDFRCLIGADGGQEAVRTLVHEIVGDDPRFEVIGWDDNLGFYLNFERLLRAVPDDVAWVALSDQDDRWYPDKLERLVPLLDNAVLCSARWRVVDAGRSATPPRRRHGLSLAGVLAQNPVPGAAMVFRRTLLDWALPFPDSA
ncbi:MAG TPA: glycosyltransferase, partial [Ornithinibacter sp.]|nr:glycosyltransferase [Ornithinibacter sp.]